MHSHADTHRNTSCHENVSTPRHVAHTQTHTRARARTCIRTLARTRKNHALVLAHERIEKGMARLARGWLTCAGGGASGYQGNRVARGYRQGRRQCGGTDRGNHPTTEQGDERHRQMTEAARRRLAGRDCECTPTNYAQHRRCGCAYVSDGAGQRVTAASPRARDILQCIRTGAERAALR